MPKGETTYISWLTAHEAGSLKLGNEGQQMRFVSLDEAVNLPLTKNRRLMFGVGREKLQKLLTAR